jgi:hypothetical protein
MLVFVIPLKSPEASASWQRVSRLFERCVRSACGQTCPQFRVIAVCNEQPEIDFEHSKLHYLKVNFSLNAPPETDPRKLLNSKRTDKGRKLLAGSVYAQRFQPTHIMMVDADDCVSNRLASFVQQHPTQPGWFINQGYRYEEGREIIYFKRRNFQKMCGTCNIVRYDLNPLPEQPEYNRGYGYYKYYIDHAKVQRMLAEQGTLLAPLPFPGAVYITETGENLYCDKNRFYQGILSRFNYRSLTPSLRQEFALYPLNQPLLLSC